MSVCYMCSSLYVTLTSHVTEYSYVCTLCPINFLVVVQLSSLSHTHTHTHVCFCENWGHPIGVMVFILYKLFVTHQTFI